MPRLTSSPENTLAEHIHESVRRSVKKHDRKYAKQLQFVPWAELSETNKEKYVWLAEELLTVGIPGFIKSE